MKKSRWVKFLLVILIIGCLTFVNFMGIPKTDVKNVKDGMRYGTDIKGGISAIFVPKVEKGTKVTGEMLDAAKEKIDLRLAAVGNFDSNVYVEKEKKRIVVEIPYKPGDTSNPEKTLEEIGSVSQLTFREVDKTTIDPDMPTPKPTEKPEATEAEATPSAEKVETDTATDADENAEVTTTPEGSAEVAETTESTEKVDESASPSEKVDETAKSDDETAKADEEPKTTEEAVEYTDEDIQKMLNEQMEAQEAEVKAYSNNTIVITGDDVDSAKPGFDENQKPAVHLELSKEGAKKFEIATEKLSKLNIPGQQDMGFIYIYMDEIMLSGPSVAGKISGGKVQISGSFTSDEATTLANQINAGALPFGLETISLDIISPTLGLGAMEVTVYAGILAILLVFLFMLLYYRLPGLIANVALIGLVSAQLLIITQMKVSLTLPGIAGIILTVGMGVDANIIIFERIKEELASGKSLLAAIDVGFKRAITAIIDSNITTVITAIMLIVLGTGPIKGFAITLLIGIIVSFISAVFATRVMLRSVATFGAVKNRWLYGAKKGGEVENA